MGDGDHVTPSKGSSMLLLANRQQRSPWSTPSTLTQKLPADAMRSHRSDVVIGKNPTSGGSSDTEVNEPMVNPTGSSSTIAVTTVTPVGKCPSTRRYFSGSIDITLDCTSAPCCVDSRGTLCG